MRYVYQIIGVFCLGWAIIYADRTALYPLLPAIANDLHLTGAQAGSIASTYFFAYIAVQPLAGVLGDRVGLKRVLVAMVLLAGLGLLGLALFANSYWLLLLFMALHGAGAGVYYPAAYSITLYTVPPERRGLSSAVINSGMSLGLALGLMAAGPLYLATASWRAPYTVMALPTLGLALLFTLAVRPVPVQPQSARGTWQVLRDPTLLCLNAIGFCSLYGFWVVITWGPTFLQTERGLGLSASGLYTALIALTALVAGLVTGRLSDVIGRKVLSLLLLPLAAAAILALALVGSVESMVAALVIYGLVGKLALDPVILAWVGDRVLATQPQAMGAAVGVFSFSAMSSAVIAPLLSGWLKDMTGSLVTAFYLGAGIVLAGVLFGVIAREVTPGPQG